MRIGARYIREVLLVGLLFALAACGGGGGGGGSPPTQSATLTYSPSTETYTAGTAITALSPTITGSLTSFSVSPALPSGLTLNATTGVISGTPSSPTATANYTISATGAASASATISITVNAVSVAAISYGSTNLTYTVGEAALTFKPVASGGAATSWSISPALPSGLDFSTTDGSISGSPDAAFTAASYVVSAQNSGGAATVTLTIAASAAPVLHLGHQNSVNVTRVTATNVFSEDTSGEWILWDYAGGSIIASGNSGATGTNLGSLTPGIDMAGTTAAIITAAGVQVRSTTDGHTLANIAVSTASWWKLATDGSYVAVGSPSGVSAWTPAGQLLFTVSGNFSQGNAFAAPNQLSFGSQAAGANSIQTIAVPSGTLTSGPAFNGSFQSWFSDGSAFMTQAGTTMLVYSAAGTQQASFTSFNPEAFGGTGSYVWTINGASSTPLVTIYPATGTNPAAVTTYTFTGSSNLLVSGATLEIAADQPTASLISVIDLSGTSPAKVDYTAAAGFGAGYSAVSASQWVAGNANGVVVDGVSLAGTPRNFGFGTVQSISGGTGHFAVATSSGTILYFNSSTLAQEGQIAFGASSLKLSADGTVLAAMAAVGFSSSTQTYALPAGTLLYSWTYPPTPPVTAVQSITLSGSGSVLGQVLSSESTQYTIEVSEPTSGGLIFSNTVTSSIDNLTPLAISPDGTLVASSQSGAASGTNLLQNGSLVTAFTGVASGWLDNSRLVVNNYNTSNNNYPYTGCAIYGPNGAPTGGACAIAFAVSLFQPVTSDEIYAPEFNRIVSVSTGTIDWASGNPQLAVGTGTTNGGAVAGPNVVFVSGIDLLAQPY